VRKPDLQLLCDPNPMCYGATGALLSVLDFVEAHRCAMGRGVTRELLSNDPAVDELLDIDVKESPTVERLVERRHFDAVLVVSNSANLKTYVTRGVPIFFVDILFWLGEGKGPDRSRLFEAEFAQAFPGVEERLRGSSGGGDITIIGPLIRESDGPTSARHGTMVHLGGARSRWIRPGENTRYPAMAAGWLRSLLPDLAPPVHLACGAEATTFIARELPTPGFEVGPLPQPEFLSRVARAELYITTPGLGGLFEALSRRTPTLLLPPQNATQVLQLAWYERLGLVRSGLNLPALDPAFPSDWVAMGEARLTETVLASLRRIDQPGTGSAVLDHLRTQLAELRLRREPRQRFMESLGPPGGRTVAAAITRFWDERWM
jgi:hypothetical protein